MLRGAVWRTVRWVASLRRPYADALGSQYGWGALADTRGIMFSCVGQELGPVLGDLRVRMRVRQVRGTGRMECWLKRSGSWLAFLGGPGCGAGAAVRYGAWIAL